MKTYTSYILLLICLICTTKATAQRMDRQQYISKYKNWAVKEMQRTGIPASITLAQGILESDCGNSDLAIDANNHFGIKCHSDWTGPTMHKDDDLKNECFRSYDSAYDSFKDHSNFLVSKSRYAELFELEKTDYKGWAKGLKKCGYATEPTYADRLIKIIEEEGLSSLDSGGEIVDAKVDKKKETEVATDIAYDVESGKIVKKKTTDPSRKPVIKSDFEIDPFEAHTVLYNNGVRYVEVKKSDSFASIANEFHLMMWELLKYNDLDKNADIKTIKHLYLRPKKNRSHPDCPTHTVKNGDTLWSIAHKYGIKLSKLRKRNGLANGVEPRVGDELELR